MYIPQSAPGILSCFFEIRGDSMLPLESSGVISQYTEKLSDIKNDHTYVVIHKSDGIVYKRLGSS